MKYISILALNIIFVFLIHVVPPPMVFVVVFVDIITNKHVVFGCCTEGEAAA